MDFKGKKAAFYTLGCKLNFAETSTIARQFENKGAERTDFKTEADIYIIHSCSVTAESDKKCRNIIRQAIKRNPKALVLVTGCYAQLQPRTIEKIKGVDFIFGTNYKFRMMDYISSMEKNSSPVILVKDQKQNREYFHATSWGDRTRSFLKVQDGCDNFCTYCTIPIARGRSRNDTIEGTVREASKAIEHGIKEIILTGVNIGDFGKSTNEKFIDLIKALDKTDIKRLRISSIEPDLLTDEIIDFVGSSNHIAPHFHIPLQCGSNEVLKLMHRHYTRELFKERVERIKRELPDAFIGVDMIAGTNGETNKLFEDSYHFVESLDVSQLHCFPYSERPNTAALSITSVIPVHERKERTKKLIALSDIKLKDFYMKQTGKTVTVLFEEPEKGKMKGFSENYIRAEINSNPGLINKFQKVKLLKINSEGNFEVEFV